MRQIKLTYVALFVGLTLLWLLVDSFVMAHYQIWPLRKVMVHYSGVLGIAAMSVAVILAARPRRFERFFDGLDKTYRLHKWLGISALVIAIFHWGWGQIPKWLVGFGWLERPARRAGEGQVHEGIFALLQRFRGIAETIGEWAFYAAVILIVLALVKRFPYRWFFRTHRWLALVYLALVVHAVVLTPPDYWTSPLGLVLAVLMAAGSLAACISLLRRIGRKHQVVGRIESLTHHRDNRVLRVDIKLDGLAGTQGRAVRLRHLRRQGRAAPLQPLLGLVQRRPAGLLHQGPRRLHPHPAPDTQGGRPGEGGRSLWLLRFPQPQAAADLGRRRHRYRAVHRPPAGASRQR